MSTLIYTLCGLFRTGNAFADSLILAGLLAFVEYARNNWKTTRVWKLKQSALIIKQSESEFAQLNPDFKLFCWYALHRHPCYRGTLKSVYMRGIRHTIPLGRQTFVHNNLEFSYEFTETIGMKESRAVSEWTVTITAPAPHGCDVIYKLLADVETDSKADEEWQTQVTDHCRSGVWEPLRKITNNSTFANVALSGGTKELIMKDLDSFAGDREWYAEKGLPYKRGLLLHGPPGTGKCLAFGTPVIMATGRIKEVQDIAVGECVMGDDSTPRQVLSLARGREEMFEIIPSRGETYVVNRSHILCLMNIDTGETQTMAVSEYLQLGGNDKRLLRGYRAAVTFAPCSKISPQRQNLQQTHIDSRILYSSYVVRRNVLDNFTSLSGDLIKCTHPSLCKDIQYLARSIGVGAYICEDARHVEICPDDNGLYEIDVKSVGEGSYYGFEIDGNKRFLLGDFTVTHNTSVIRAISNRYKRHIYCLSIGALLNDTALRTAIRGIPDNALIVMEDIDCMRCKLDRSGADKPAHEGSWGITLSALLNFLDGITSKDGQMVVITTNDISSLDPAIYRDGRCDITVELGNCTEQSLRHMYSMFFDDAYVVPKGANLASANPARVINHLARCRHDATKAKQSLGALLKN